MPNNDEVIAALHSMANPEAVKGMVRFGMAERGRLGISVPELRSLAKKLGKDHGLALELWATRVAEARILASMIAEPSKLTETAMDCWVADFDSWDVCDQVCMNLFDKTPLAWNKIWEWAGREEEFVRRASLALIACLAWHDKKTEDEAFIQLFPAVQQCAEDERNFVKKAASWALRNVGKRNRRLNREVLHWTENVLGKIDAKASGWIAADVIRELKSDAVQKRIKQEFV